jgi:F-type H+-transporting ATPase subunit a
VTPFPAEVLRIGPVVVSDTVVLSLILGVLLVVFGRLLFVSRRTRFAAEYVYETLEASVLGMTTVDARPLLPLVLTLWLFIGAANLVGLVPGLQSPTRDLSLAAALAVISFAAGHYYAFKRHRFAYLRQYIEPSLFLLPLNVLGEVSRTVALALRLFGNMLSASLTGAIMVYLAGFLIPVPLLVLGVLTSLVQAYIFGVLTLVFAAAALAAATPKRPSSEDARPEPKEKT